MNFLRKNSRLKNMRDKLFLLLGSFVAGLLARTVLGKCGGKKKEKRDEYVIEIIDVENEDNGLLSLLLGSNKKKDIYQQAYERFVEIPLEEPVDFILQTNGGSLFWCQKLTNLIRTRSGKVRIFVKDRAHSAGTLLCLAADEIYLTQNASLSPIDPQMDVISNLLTAPIKQLSHLFDEKRSEILNNNLKNHDEYYRITISKQFNPTYDSDLLIKTFYTDPVSHSCLFFSSDLSDLKLHIFSWTGKLDSIPPRK